MGWWPLLAPGLALVVWLMSGWVDAGDPGASPWPSLVALVMSAGMVAVTRGANPHRIANIGWLDAVSQGPVPDGWSYGDWVIFPRSAVGDTFPSRSSAELGILRTLSFYGSTDCTPRKIPGIVENLSLG